MLESFYASQSAGKLLGKSKLPESCWGQSCKIKINCWGVARVEIAGKKAHQGERLTWSWRGLCQGS